MNAEEHPQAKKEAKALVSHCTVDHGVCLADKLQKYRCPILVH